MRCRVSACPRDVKSKGLCHVHLKESMQPRKLVAYGSDFSAWKKRANQERSWAKEAVSEDRNARARRKRTSALALATPAWLSKSQLAEIAAFYDEARRLTVATGERHEVDHVVPLHSPVVSGLHVPWNMRVISKEENNRKGNRAFNEARSPEELE